MTTQQGKLLHQREARQRVDASLDDIEEIRVDNAGKLPEEPASDAEDHSGSQPARLPLGPVAGTKYAQGNQR